MSKIGTTKLIIALLAEQGAYPGLTRGEIRDALGLPADKEITARIREARKEGYGGFDVRTEIISKSVVTYWLPIRERARAAAKVREWIKEAA
jgi:hypothetical protein